MKHGFSILLLSALAGLVPFAAAFGQTIIQHTGANDPLAEGFAVDARGDVRLEPIFDDSGFDAWAIHARAGNEGARYSHPLSPENLQKVMELDWRLSATIRFIEIPEFGGVSFGLNTGQTLFRVRITLDESGGVAILGDGFEPFALELNPTAYHQYEFSYDPVSQTASLWVNGLEQVSNIAGFSTPGALPEIRFGAAESVVHTHWNEVTLTIIPEPAAAALLAGAVALLAVGILRRRRGV